MYVCQARKRGSCMGCAWAVGYAKVICMPHAKMAIEASTADMPCLTRFEIRVRALNACCAACYFTHAEARISSRGWVAASCGALRLRSTNLCSQCIGVSSGPCAAQAGYLMSVMPCCACEACMSHGTACGCMDGNGVHHGEACTRVPCQPVTHDVTPLLQSIQLTFQLEYEGLLNCHSALYPAGRVAVQ
jgi:hypothetical protein